MQAVDVSRDENRHSRDPVGKMELPFHVKLPCQGCEGAIDVISCDAESFKFPLNPHKKNLSGPGGMLVGLNNVAAMMENEV
jgi:hypothetical protein